MFTSYYDEGGGDDHGFTVVCGWASSLKKWEGFEVDWKLMLSHYDVPYFHMKELLWPDRQSPYWKWKNRKAIKDKFLSSAAEIIRAHINHGFISFVSHQDFSTVDSLFDLRSVYRTPYALAGRGAMEIAENWHRASNPPGTTIEHVFADTSKRFVNSLIASTRSIEPFLDIPLFKAAKDEKPSSRWPEGRMGLVHLQAADYLAYEGRKVFYGAIKHRILRPRRSFIAILNIRVTVAEVRAFRLAKFCYSRRIPRRLNPDSEIYAKFSR